MNGVFLQCNFVWRLRISLIFFCNDFFSNLNFVSPLQLWFSKLCSTLNNNEEQKKLEERKMKYKRRRKKKEELQDKQMPAVELLKDFVTKMSSVMDELKTQNNITMYHDNLPPNFHQNMYDAVKRFNKSCEVVDMPFQCRLVTYKKTISILIINYCCQFQFDSADVREHIDNKQVDMNVEEKLQLQEKISLDNFLCNIDRCLDEHLGNSKRDKFLFTTISSHLLCV